MARPLPKDIPTMIRELELAKHHLKSCYANDDLEGAAQMRGRIMDLERAIEGGRLLFKNQD